MSLITTGFIDPKDYPFKKIIDEQAHLDTDELRHTIKSVHHVIDQHFKGEEHLYCDKSQRDGEGKFRRPKILVESERRGFTSVLEMYESDKKAEEDKKVQESADLKKQVADLTALVQQLASSRPA